MKDIAPEDRPFSVRLLQDIYSRFTFDPEIIAALLLDLHKLGRVKDTRKGARVAVFANVDYAAVTRPVNKMSL